MVSNHSLLTKTPMTGTNKRIFQCNHLFLSALIALFLMSAFSNPSLAQRPEGHIRYLKINNWTKMLAAVEYLSKQQRERAQYMWGSNSEWKEYTELYFSPEGTKYFDSEEKAEADLEGFSWRNDEFMINRDFSENRMLDIITHLGKTYVINDTLPPMNWKILNDIKEVAGHICMSAYCEDTLMMMKVKAWFALDIPVSGGPERFWGLPGLILEVDINNGGKIITADKLALKPIKEELKLPRKVKGKHIHESDYRVLLKKYFDERRKAEEPPFWGIRY